MVLQAYNMNLVRSLICHTRNMLLQFATVIDIMWFFTNLNLYGKRDIIF